jgi:hypothetical protein
MNRLLAKFFLMSAGLVIVSAPLLAHHGNAAFNYDKKITVSGTVTDWLWANPHCLVKVDVKDDKGEISHWTIEAGGPPDMAREGWTHNSFKPSDEITATIIQAKNGEPIGRFVGQNNIILNGKPFPPGSAGASRNAQNPSKP